MLPPVLELLSSPELGTLNERAELEVCAVMLSSPDVLDLSEKYGDAKLFPAAGFSFVLLCACLWSFCGLYLLLHTVKKFTFLENY